MKINCPVGDMSCPYYNISNGLCKMPIEGGHPAEECDDYFFIMNLGELSEEWEGE